MYPVQLALLAAEALVMALLVFGLFRSRASAGRSPLYVVLGGFLYVSTSLTLRVEVAPGWTLQPAASVVFGACLAAVLLVYVTHEARDTRKLIGALVLGNAGLTLLALIIGQHARIPGSQLPLGLTAAPIVREVVVAVAGRRPSTPCSSAWCSSTSSSVATRRGCSCAPSSRSAPWAPPPPVAFTTLGVWGRADVSRLVVAEVVGSLTASAGYAALLWAYLRWAEPASTTSTGTGDVSDVLQELTYRQLYEQARSRLTRDALTGVHNRGYFDEAFTRAVAHASRYGEHLSIVIADADHFKTINDQPQSPDGRPGTQGVRRRARSSAPAPRMSCAATAGTSSSSSCRTPTCRKRAAPSRYRFRKRLAGRTRARAPDPGVDAIEITATVGIASLQGRHRDPGAPDDLLRLADNRLYVGKRAGRNRIVWEDLPVSSVQ